MTRLQDSDRSAEELADALIRRLEADQAGHLQVFSGAHFWRAQVVPSQGGQYVAHGPTPEEAMAELELRLRQELQEPDALTGPKSNGTGDLVHDGEPVELHDVRPAPLPEDLETSDRSVLPVVHQVESLLFRKILSWLEGQSYRRVKRELREAFDPARILTSDPSDQT